MCRNSYTTILSKTKDSQFEFQRKIYHKMGISSVLATPILVNQNRFAGAIVISISAIPYSRHMYLLRDTNNDPFLLSVFQETL